MLSLKFFTSSCIRFISMRLLICLPLSASSASKPVMGTLDAVFTRSPYASSYFQNTEGSTFTVPVDRQLQADDWLATTIALDKQGLCILQASYPVRTGVLGGQFNHVSAEDLDSRPNDAYFVPMWASYAVCEPTPSPDLIAFIQNHAFIVQHYTTSDYECCRTSDIDADKTLGTFKATHVRIKLRMTKTPPMLTLCINLLETLHESTITLTIRRLHKMVHCSLLFSLSLV